MMRHCVHAGPGRPFCRFRPSRLRAKSLRENKALVPDLGTTFVVRHSPACAVPLTPGRCSLWIRGDRLWYVATTRAGHNGRRIDRHVSQVVVAYHKLSRLVLMLWCGRRLPRAPVGSRSSGGGGGGGN